MTETFIDYNSLVDEAMHIIVKKSLEIIASNTFCGDHHFFISFLTEFPGVSISEDLRKKYETETTMRKFGADFPPARLPLQNFLFL